MTLNPVNCSNLEQLALKGLIVMKIRKLHVGYGSWTKRHMLPSQKSYW